MSHSQLLAGDVFVREYGGKVCPMPAPDVSVVIEVWTREEPWLDAFHRMVNHLKAGVTVVLFLSERHRSAAVFRNDTAPTQFKTGETLTIPDVLPGFSVSVARFFE
jgi:Uma2 family endonuclease